jgi:hypothetical protein
MKNKTQVSHCRSSTYLNCTRATLYHISGEVSYMMLAAPKYTNAGEEQEKAANFLRDYIYSMNGNFINVKKYQIEMGKIDSKSGAYISTGIVYPIKEL